MSVAGPRRILPQRTGLKAASAFRKLECPSDHTLRGPTLATLRHVAQVLARGRRSQVFVGAPAHGGGTRGAIGRPGRAGGTWGPGSGWLVQSALTDAASPRAHAGTMSDPPYLKALKGEMPFQRNGLVRWYKKAFIDTGSMKPIFHVVFAVMSIGYIFDFARHLRRASPPSCACAGKPDLP